MKITVGSIEEGSRFLLEGIRTELGIDLYDENFLDTPARMARMYREVLSGMVDTERQIQSILSSAFPCDNDNLVLVRDIETFSMCPHHMLPVHYRVHAAYVPKGTVVGLSKIPRLVNVLARRPVLQEQFTEDVVSNLMRIPGCLGAACVVEGVHYCMVMRGVKQTSAKTTTSSLKGVFFDKPEARAEFMGLVGR